MVPRVGVAVACWDPPTPSRELLAAPGCWIHEHPTHWCLVSHLGGSGCLGGLGGVLQIPKGLAPRPEQATTQLFLDCLQAVRERVHRVRQQHQQDQRQASSSPICRGIALALETACATLELADVVSTAQRCHHHHHHCSHGSSTGTFCAPPSPSPYDEPQHPQPQCNNAWSQQQQQQQQQRSATCLAAMCGALCAGWIAVEEAMKMSGLAPSSGGSDNAERQTVWPPLPLSDQQQQHRPPGPDPRRHVYRQF